MPNFTFLENVTVDSSPLQAWSTYKVRHWCEQNSTFVCTGKDCITNKKTPDTCKTEGGWQLCLTQLLLSPLSNITRNVSSDTLILDSVVLNRSLMLLLCLQNQSLNNVSPTKPLKRSYILVKEEKQKELKSIATYAYDLLFQNYYKFLDLSSCNLVVSRVEAIFISLQINLYH